MVFQYRSILHRAFLRKMCLAHCTPSGKTCIRYDHYDMQLKFSLPYNNLLGNTSFVLLQTQDDVLYISVHNLPEQNCYLIRKAEYNLKYI